MDYFEQMAVLSQTLLSALAEGLKLAPNHFDDIIMPTAGDHTSYMRLNFYPPPLYEDEDEESRLGISRHTDAGVLTVLYQDPIVSSLEVYSGTKQINDDGKWIPVHPPPAKSRGFTVNIGDMLQVMSNDIYKAPEHRVLATPAGKSRYSAPFFYNPSYDGKIHPSTTNNVEQDRYQSFTWRHFRRQRFAGDFEDLGRKEIQIEDFKVGPIAI